MEFEHPIFNSPEEYKEYTNMMNELAQEAERETGDPQPEDFNVNAYWEDALELSRSIPESDLRYWKDHLIKQNPDDHSAGKVAKLLRLLMRDNSHNKFTPEIDFDSNLPF